MAGDKRFVYVLRNTDHIPKFYIGLSFQNHLRETWDKWQAIKDRNDAACAETKAQVQTEWDRHQLSFQPAAVSNHTSGTAFDANWTPGTLNIDQLASGCNLSRPVPNDTVHFVYGGG